MKEIKLISNLQNISKPTWGWIAITGSQFILTAILFFMIQKLDRNQDFIERSQRLDSAEINSHEHWQYAESSDVLDVRGHTHPIILSHLTRHSHNYEYAEKSHSHDYAEELHYHDHDLDRYYAKKSHSHKKSIYDLDY